MKVTCRISEAFEVSLLWIRTASVVLVLTSALSVSSVVAEEVDLELVLAMDGSGSISKDEYVLQLEGTAQAFEDPAIQHAILSGPLGKVAVSVVIWSDAAFQKFNSGWYLLTNAETANAFAHHVRHFHKRAGRKFGIGGGGTGIGEGVRFAIQSLETNQYVGLRRVIDVSGDGIETDPWFKKAIQMPAAKMLALAANVTINGLPILNRDFPRLDRYYREQVIVGPGAFIVVADGFADFGRAIREKLWSEISHKIATRVVDSHKLASLGYDEETEQCAC